MTLRPVRFVAVAVLTCTFVLTGCTAGTGSHSASSAASAVSGPSTPAAEK